MPEIQSRMNSRCSSCGQELLEGLLFCTSCGKETQAAKDVLKGPLLACPLCHSKDGLSRNFCISCGTRIDPSDERIKQRATKRTGMNWRTAEAKVLQAAKKTTPAIAIKTNPRSITKPLALGAACGLILSLAVLFFGEPQLNYLVARSAAGKFQVVMFVRLPAADGGSGLPTFLQPQPPVEVKFSPQQEENSSGNSELIHTSATTDGTGMLLLPALRPGLYNITLSAKGRESASTSIRVLPGVQTIIGWPEALTLPPAIEG